MFQQVLPFDDFYAWHELVKTLKLLPKGARFVFYGVGKRITFTREVNAEVSIVTGSLSESLPTPSFEVTFMTAVLKDPHKHLCIYEKSATRNKNWKLQIFRCVDPDCKSYTKAELLIGKRARCHECKNDIIIDKSQVRNTAIVGLCCSKALKAIQFRAAKATMKNIFAEVEAKEIAEEGSSFENVNPLDEIIENGLDFSTELFGK